MESSSEITDATVLIFASGMKFFCLLRIKKSIGRMEKVKASKASMAISNLILSVPSLIKVYINGTTINDVRPRKSEID